MGALTHNGEIMQSLPANASQINFDKTGTDLNATQTEAAIKEVNGKVNTNAEDITQLKSGLTSLADTHLPFQRDSVNKNTYTFNVSPNKTNSFRAAIVIQHNDYHPSIYLLYMGTGLTATVNIGKVFGDSNATILSSASINGDVLTITFANEVYGGCSLIWLN